MIDGDHRYLTPWTSQNWRGFNGEENHWLRRYCFQSIHRQYAARIGPVAGDLHISCALIEDLSALAARLLPVEEMKREVDILLVKLGYVLLNESQAKTMELLL